MIISVSLAGQGIYQLANILTLTTEDAAFSYTNPFGGSGDDQKYHEINWGIDHNVQNSTTLGHLIKVQKGNHRITATLNIGDSRTAIEANLFPMLNHASTIDVTFSRNIPTRGSNKSKFEMIDFELLQEFNDGAAQEVRVKLIEVIGV